MYICWRCGQRETELPQHREYHTELDGSPFEVVEDNRCQCGGEYEEAERCAVCGEWLLADELTEGVCEYCLERGKTVENVTEFVGTYATEKMPVEIELNLLVLDMFSDDEINEILTRELTESVKAKRSLPSSLESALNHGYKDDWAKFIKEKEC